MEIPQIPSVPAGSKQNKTLLIIIAVVVGLSVLGSLGKYVAGFAMKKAFEASTGVRVDEKSGSVSFQGKDGRGSITIDGNSGTGSMKVTDEKGQVTTITGDSGSDGQVKKLPTGFPTGFPVYSGMTIASTFGSESAEGNTFLIVWNSADAAAKVTEFYKTSLKSAGWTSTTTMETESGTTIIFERGEKDAARKDSGWVTVGATDGQTEVSLSLNLMK